jgi:hypothetical protein
MRFDDLCRLAGLPVPVSEYRFAPPRRWRFDFAWPNTGHKLALEVQGGLFIQGRHSRGAALLNEHEKLNAAAMLGYRVCFCTPKQIQNGEALAIVEKALRGIDPAPPLPL